MRSLFLKIFLWFWAAFVLVAVTLVIVAANTSSSEMKKARISLYLPMEGKLAADIYEREGKAGLKRHFDRLIEFGMVSPYFLDENGKDVLGRNPPMRAFELARTAREDAPVFSKFRGQRGFAAQQVVGSSGKKYTELMVISRPSFSSILKELSTETWFSVLAVLLVGGVLCLWLTRHIANPIVRLSNTAGSIADGLLDARCEKNIRSRHDEIGRLGQSFDRMAERIESLVRGQQRLLGDVSHELRSPLARLSVAEGLLRQCPSEERPEFLDRIAVEVERLDQLIGQLLILARVDSTADSVRKERVELNGLIQEIATDGDFEAQTRQCNVRVDSLNVCATLGVGEQLRRAIENVVRNAVRFTSPGTGVEITVDRYPVPAASTAIVQIRDHGPGVPPEHIEKIFHPFYRVPMSQGQTGGAGLGLAITERIIKMHGGNVSASNASDGGLIVKLELPLDG